MKHLDEIGATYWEHFKFAIRIGFVMIIAGILVMIHAFFPNFMRSVGSDVIRQLHAILNEGGDDDDDDPRSD